VVSFLLLVCNNHTLLNIIARESIFETKKGNTARMPDRLLNQAMFPVLICALVRDVITDNRRKKGNFAFKKIRFFSIIKKLFNPFKISNS